MKKEIFKERLKAARKQSGLSAEKFAEKYNIPVNTYRDWEAGRTQPPSYSASAILSAMSRDLIADRINKMAAGETEKKEFSNNAGSIDVSNGTFFDIRIPVENIPSLKDFHGIDKFPKALIKVSVSEDGMAGRTAYFYTGFYNMGDVFFQVGLPMPETADAKEFVLESLNMMLESDYLQWGDAIKQCRCDIACMKGDQALADYYEEAEDSQMVLEGRATYEMHSDATKETLPFIFNRTLNNCIYYEKEGTQAQLLNEIGALRGVLYCLESVGIRPQSIKMYNLFEKQQQLKEELSLSPRCTLSKQRP
jgi:transcriptional regulator with XRE-family HTH domain